MGGAERHGGGLRRPRHESSVFPADRGASHRRTIHTGFGARHSLAGGMDFDHHHIDQVLLVRHAGRQQWGGRDSGADVTHWRERLQTGVQRSMTAMGLMGAAVIYGDGVITPAISVLERDQGASMWSRPTVQAVRHADCGGLILRWPVQHAAIRHRKDRARVRSHHARLVRRDRGARRDLGSRAIPRPSPPRSIPRYAVRFMMVRPAGRHGVPWCSAEFFCASPAARPCTPTWVISAKARSECPGTRSPCRRCC